MPVALFLICTLQNSAPASAGESLKTAAIFTGSSTLALPMATAKASEASSQTSSSASDPNEPGTAAGDGGAKDSAEHTQELPRQKLVVPYRVRSEAASFLASGGRDKPSAMLTAILAELRRRQPAGNAQAPSDVELTLRLLAQSSALRP
jgi:hypothetical protein